MRHIVLLGDSIFDNAAYVGGGPDVITQLRTQAGALSRSDVRATLLAVDGSVITDVAAQLSRLPADATDAVVSVGGNDALRHVDLLQRRARDGAEALAWFTDAVAPFAVRYRAMLDAVARPGAPVTVCTIYEGNLEPALQRPARAAVAIFNDAIQRVARAAGAGVIELRDVCSEPGDYANPIEPSVRGGARIAAVILRHVLLAPAAPGGAPTRSPAHP